VFPRWRVCDWIEIEGGRGAVILPVMAVRFARLDDDAELGKMALYQARPVDEFIAELDTADIARRYHNATTDRL
jgi:hypothetical protein